MVLSAAEQQKFLEDIRQGKIAVIDPRPALENMARDLNGQTTTNQYSGPTIVPYTSTPINSAPTNSAPTNSAPIISQPTEPVISYPTISYPIQTGYSNNNLRPRNSRNSNRYTILPGEEYDPSMDNGDSNSTNYYLYLISSLVITYFLFNRK